jgi:hypothetical protein
VAPIKLRDDGPGHATPREVAAEREGNADGGIQCARHFAHKQDDRHHHQPGRDNCRVTAMVLGASHHPTASGGEDEEKRPQQLEK